MKKKFLSVVFTLFMLSLMPVIANAATSGDCGTDGANVTWTLDDEGTLTISGTGDMKDYSNYSASSPWYSEREKIKNIIIKNGVTSIGGDAFRSCDNLIGITIPKSMTSIGSSAFWCCYNIDGLYIADLAAYLNIDFGNADSNPMNYTNKLYLNNKRVAGDIVIPDDVTSICDYAFNGCDGITSVKIPNSVKSIGKNAFQECIGLSSIIIPDSVTSIGNYAFDACDNLKSITIGNRVKNIGQAAFYSCDNLISVTIPDSVTSIDGWAFMGCRLSSITIGKGVKSIGINAFCINTPNDVYISDISAWCGIKFNGENSNPLNGAKNLYVNNELVKNLVIPDNVTKIENYAFANFTGLKSIALGNGITNIGSNAFYGLEHIIIPKSVTEIEGSAFAHCPELTTVEYCGSEAEWNEVYIGANNDYLKNATIHYNSQLFIPEKITLTTPTITNEETETQWVFTVDVTQPYINCNIYAVLYDDNDKLLISNKESLDPFNNTTIAVDKKDNTAYAKIFVWTKDMQPITYIEEIPLI